MSKIIVVEGCDNAGKTTIAMKIAKRFKALFVKTEAVPPKPHFLNQYQTVLESARYYGNGVVVSDRHMAISEVIYGTIVRSHPQMDVIEAAKVVVNSIDLLIYCRPPDATILHTMPERDQMHGVLENARALIHAYDEYFSNLTHKHFLRFDWTRDSEEALYQEIQSYARLP